jgi:hypothetical protein
VGFGGFGGGLRAFLRTTFVTLLVAALVEAPALAAPAKALGVVTQAQGAQLDNADAAMGASLYPGDSLITNQGGIVRLRLGTSQIYLLASSAATLSDSSSGARAQLDRGTAGFSSTGDVVELHTTLATVRSKPNQRAYGQLTIVGTRELLVSSFNGSFEVEFDGETHTIAEGRAYRVVAEPEAPEPQMPGHQAGSIPTQRKKKALFITGVATGSFFGIWIYHEMTESSSKSDSF